MSLAGLAEFNKLMTHDVTLKEISRNVSGDISIENEDEIKGFVEYNQKKIVDKSGNDVISTAIVFLKNDAEIDLSKEYIIDQDSPQVRENMEVLIIEPIDDPRSGLTHHYELMVR